jgi:hypothetical protein
LEYIKHWKQDISIDQVPGRIVQRLAENFSQMLKFLFSTKQVAIDSIIEVDIYGFKKTMVALSSQGKIFGLSSFDGTIQWTSNLIEGTKRIFIRNTEQRQDEEIQSQIVSCTEDSITFLNQDGAQLYS